MFILLSTNVNKQLPSLVRIKVSFPWQGDFLFFTDLPCPLVYRETTSRDQNLKISKGNPILHRNDGLGLNREKGQSIFLRVADYLDKDDDGSGGCDGDTHTQADCFALMSIALAPGISRDC